MKKILCFLITHTSQFILLFIIISYSCTRSEVPELSIVTDKEPGAAVLHGLTKLSETLQTKNISFEKISSIEDAKGKTIIVAGLALGDGTASQILKFGNHAVPNVPEALTIWKTTWMKKTVWVTGGFDDVGLMYALSDIAERISWSHQKSFMKEVAEMTEQPDVRERSISIYTMNRTYWERRFYDEDYWRAYLDVLAKNRFNSMVVIFGYENGGFLAPCYPYFFDMEEFPDVRMIGITPEEQKHNLDALNNLIRMAHERGIRFKVGIWDHIYRGGVQGGGIPGTKEAPDKPVPGLVWGVNSDNLVPYNKAALARLVKLVPELDGIQFRMHNESGLKREEQESFWYDVFTEMKKTAPDLQLDLRAKELPESVVQSAIDIGVKFRITTKYWMEQMGMPYHPTQINPEKSPRRHSYADMLRYPQQYKIHWRLWNGGTTRILLWGDPEYVRRFAESTHLYDGDGYEVNEPLATKMEAQPHDAVPFELLNSRYQYYKYEFERYWHFFQVFGRIGYNPATSPKVFQNEFERRFGKKAAPYLETALHKASWILPRIITSSYPYSGFPTTRGWAEKQRLGDLPSFARAAGSDLRQFANFDEEAQILIDGGETAKILPSMNSKWFEQTSADINKLLMKAEKAAGNDQNKEFNSTITDLNILSNLALYHARRIPAAVSYRLFERTKDVSALDEAISYERSAIAAWRQLVESAGDYYNFDLMMGVRVADLCGHWRDELVALEKGLEGLEGQRANFKTEDKVKSAPKYITASYANNDRLFKINHLPVQEVPVDKPITISARVTSPAGIKWVHLLYRNVNQDIEYQTMAMEATGDKNTYQAIVPADQIDPKWDFMYFIEFMDNNGKGKIYPDLNHETPYIIVKLLR
jgi:ribosomal protein L18E